MRGVPRTIKSRREMSRFNCRSRSNCVSEEEEEGKEEEDDDDDGCSDLEV